MRAIEYGISFGLLSSAALESARHKPFIFQSKEDFKAAYTQNIEGGQPLSLTVGNYSNDLLTLGLGVAALYSLVRLVMCLDNKPIIQQQPLQQPQQNQSQSQSVVINNTNRLVNVAARSPQDGSRQPKPRSVDDEPIRDLTGNWINQMIVDDQGVLKRQHYKFDGVTQSGKTTLAEYVMSQIIDSLGVSDAEYLLIDPKYLVAQPSWSIIPFCSSIDKALQALELFCKEMIARQQDPNFIPSEASPIFFIIDEWDWIYEEYKNKALSLLRKLIKVGAELRCYVILLGQSPVSGEVGLSPTDFDQLVRMSVGKSSIKVLSNDKHYPFSDRTELHEEADRLYKTGCRFALVQEHGKGARLEIIPQITKPNAKQIDKPIDNVIPLKKRQAS